jgi:hypothetical protein
VAAGVGDVLGHLDAQLAGGDDDERLGDVAAAVGGGAGVVARGPLPGRGEPLQQRDAEAEGLAGAGAGLADDVFAGQGQRQRQLLDGEGALDAGLGERADDLRAGAELGEGGGVGPDGGAGLEGVGVLGAFEGRLVDGWCFGRVVRVGQNDRLSPRAAAEAGSSTTGRARAGEPTRRCTHQVVAGVPEGRPRRGQSAHPGSDAAPSPMIPGGGGVPPGDAPPHRVTGAHS